MGRPVCNSVAGSFLLLSSISWNASAELRLRVEDVNGAPVPNAVVYLLGEVPTANPTPRNAVIDQQDKQFVPAVTVIQTGAEIEFPNSDAVSHHVYSFAQPNTFELPLYKQTQRPVVRFDHSGIVTLGCNIHDSMLGYIVVVDTPWFGFTNAAGELSLPDTPAGQYDVYVWSQRLDPAVALQLQSIGVPARSSAPVQVLTTTSELRGEPGVAGNALAWEDY